MRYKQYIINNNSNDNNNNYYNNLYLTQIWATANRDPVYDTHMYHTLMYQNDTTDCCNWQLSGSAEVIMLESNGKPRGQKGLSIMSQVIALEAEESQVFMFVIVCDIKHVCKKMFIVFHCSLFDSLWNYPLRLGGPRCFPIFFSRCTGWCGSKPHLFGGGWVGLNRSWSSR